MYEDIHVGGMVLGGGWRALWAWRDTDGKIRLDTEPVLAFVATKETNDYTAGVCRLMAFDRHLMEMGSDTAAVLVCYLARDEDQRDFHDLATREVETAERERAAQA